MSGLPPGELGARLDRILGAAERLVQAMPASALARPLPPPDGTVGTLAFRLFRTALAYVDGMDMGGLNAAWLEEEAPADLADGPAVARYGALVRGRVSGWFEGASPRELARIIENTAGPLSGGELLLRATARSAERLVRLHGLAAGLGVGPLEPLAASDLDGLPPPERPF